ncbi:MAG: gamma-glutamylcyclotransferase [Gammaproteobacteria bacterium]|nr:gamma-glutamylcyclotransferase [Gammaproteobacteria bacterium]NIN63002.1 gamma-glutamylcyclotransferase [Gammaproteobacteria bacterium]NIO63298.1 gamma-glutamylcyclotransferase [Gammaproteobacteria bacterium]NIP50003.1 gamma-glutamylcyclotransferase [Gammaproteobacteria bacterium]NIQ12222.1 gamma-glutamylcyclotransferase [Gammaproteobacteria bacterium]
MHTRFYFAYGSNLHPNWLRSRVPSAEIVSRLDIARWKLCFHKAGTDGSAKCNIISTNSAEDIVHGVIYEFNAMEQDRLDEAELGYHARLIQFGQYQDMLIYVARNETISDQILPYSWYRDIVIAGAEYHRFPGNYIKFLQSFNASPDPNEERDRSHRSMVWTGIN